uniref:Protein krueppel n=1 Tax=Anopheles farauti TaxID=69004 RepID=A0A182QF16_9DIPT
MNEDMHCAIEIEQIATKLPDVCRVCLADGSDGQTDLYHIDDVYVTPGELESINSFRDIINIFVNDEINVNRKQLPTSICTQCASRAQDAYRFIDHCQRTEALLEAHFSQNDEVIAVHDAKRKSSTEEFIEVQDPLIPLEENEETQNHQPDHRHPAQGEETQPNIVKRTKVKRDGDRWACDKCDKTFTQAQALRRHCRVHDESGKARRHCTYCERSFLRSDDLVRHLRTHTNERPYKCDQCTKTFKQCSELKEHRLTHSSEKQFKCTECGKHFASRNGLFVHRRNHRGEKPHVCPHCDKRFATTSERVSHIRYRHRT